MNSQVLQSGMKKTSGQDNNPQLQEAPLKLEMDPSNVNNKKIKSAECLLLLFDDNWVRIQEMEQNVNKNQRLQKYFVKAGTNSKQLQIVISKLKEDLKIIKKSILEKDTNFVIVGEILSFMNHILKNNQIKNMKNIEKAIWIVQFQSKVICSMQFVMKSLKLPYDITTSNKNDYEHVWKHIKLQKIKNEKQLKSGLALTKRMMAITTSACINQQQSTWAISKLMSFGFSYPQYFFSDKQGQLRSMIFYRKPTIQMARKIWNIPQNGVTRQFAKLGMKNIRTNMKIYIPIDQSKTPTQLTAKDQQNAIKVRILYNKNIFIKNKIKKSGFFTFCQTQNVNQNQKDIQTIILHMHGGGFLALSSRSMQVYTRRWAIELGVPVFSVDYRMPPQHRFPTAPLDCLKVYKFLLYKIKDYYNINPKKIIITGDSAGGNLAFSLTGLILRQGLPPPYGILAAYPACNLRKLFSPSKLYAFTDPLLNPSMLLLCLKQYLQGKQIHQTDPIASPLLLTEQFVGGLSEDKRFPLKWPPTIIQVGAQDPLYDDSLKIMERMVASNIKCKCQVYQNLSHGFLNLQFVIPECQITIRDSVKHLQELLK